jgi:hypothetical protein
VTSFLKKKAKDFRSSAASKLETPRLNLTSRDRSASARHKSLVNAHPRPSHHPLDTQYVFRPNPASSIRRREVKVFWFFSSEKNKTLLFLKKKKQKDFCLLGMLYRNPGLGRKVPSIQLLLFFGKEDLQFPAALMLVDGGAPMV